MKKLDMFFMVAWCLMLVVARVRHPSQEAKKKGGWAWPGCADHGQVHKG